MSWLGDSIGSTSILRSIGQLSYNLTEPVFATVRRRMPNIGDLPIDFSPLVVMTILFILRSIALRFGI